MKKRIIITITLGLIAISNLAVGQNSLFIPPTLIGPVFDLEMQHGTHNYFPGISTPSMGFNGDILGPTLIMEQGDNVQLNVLNSLGEETTVHWHGLHVAPEDDGGPHSVISPNETYNPEFEVLDKASTYWYHPHLHHHTFNQVSLGLAGMIIVRDTEEAALNLPRTYGVDDFPLIMQTKAIKADTVSLFNGLASTGGGLNNNDSTFVMNGTRDAALNVPRQVIRFRLLNGAAHRVFFVGLSDNSSFHQIGSDGGLLAAPVSLNRVMLAPGERAEILVNFSAYGIGSDVQLVSYNSELPAGYFGALQFDANSSSAPDGYGDNPANGTDVDLLNFHVTNPTSNPVTSILPSLVTVIPIPEASADVTRVKYLHSGGGPRPRIGPDPNGNNPLFDIDVINDTIKLDDTEIWEIHGDVTKYHPFHIHDIQFFILSINGSAPPPNLQGRKDLVLVPPGQIVRIIAKFDDFAGDIPYMYHCHILPHEDLGMMGQFVVSHDLYVDNIYAGTENGTITNPYNTITEALQEAQHGSNIHLVRSGNHFETPPNLLINKRVKLVLENGPVVIK